jgi:hypothetical protein
VYPWPENSRIAKKTSGPSLGGAGWGKLLDWAMQQLASIVPAFNVTNAVKHFKFEERSNRRIHNKPSTSPSESRRPWRDAEIQSVGPKVIVVSWLHLIRRRSSVRPIVAREEETGLDLGSHQVDNPKRMNPRTAQTAIASNCVEPRSVTVLDTPGDSRKWIKPRGAAAAQNCALNGHVR